MRNRVFATEINEIPAIFQPKYFRTLDGLRAISIIWVIVAHFNLSIKNPTLSSIFWGGGLGVHIFFVLSGFLITTLLLKEKITNGFISLKDFYIRRIFRILPVAFLFLFVIFVMNLWLALGITTRDYLHVLTFTENFNFKTNWYVHHFWSLSVEEQFYLIFPIFIKRNLNGYIKLSGLLIVISPVVSYLAHHDVIISNHFKDIITFSDAFLNGGLLSILIGSLTSILLFKLNAAKPVKTNGIGFLQLFIVFLIWFSSQHPGFGGSNMILCAFLIAFLITISMINEDTFVNRFLNLKYIKLVGVLSYSLYIWQQLFDNNQPWRNSFKYGDSILLNTCDLFLVAYISYNFYEKKFIRLKNKFKSGYDLKQS